MATRLGPTELASLYDLYAPAVQRRARALLRDEHEAWDVVHEVFRMLAEAPDAFRREAHPMTFIYRAATNSCLNLLRARGVRARQEVPNQEMAPGQLAADARDLILKLLHRLDARALQIATLHFFDGMTQEEICAVVGLSRKTVGLELQRVRALAIELGELPEAHNG